MKVLAFEDSVDIEALLISGGVDISLIQFKQYWDSVNHLQRISEFAPDVLLLDHYMPPTKGLDVLKNLLKLIESIINTSICIGTRYLA